MRRALLSLSILIAFLAILTSCGRSDKVVYRDRTVTSIVYRDPTTTTTTVPPESKYTDDFAISQLKSDSFKFNANFPTFDYNEEVTSFKVEADSRTTQHRRYYTDLIASQDSSGKLIYCRELSEACSLHASFGAEVYPDNAVNRQALTPLSFLSCTDITFTGVAGRDCQAGPDEYSDTYYRDVQVYRNGWIYHLTSHGDIPDPQIYDYFVYSFGFSDV